MVKVSENESIAYTEVLYILKSIEKEYYEKIPVEIIDFLENNYIEQYEHYDEEGKLKISDLAEELLCFLNLEYWCSPEEKNRLTKKYMENDKKLNEKYDINKTFNERKNGKEFNQKEKDKNLQLIEVKQTFWKKIIRKIQSFFSFVKR